MAESILKIHTQNGDVPVGYPGLADKPVSDKTLSVDGAFADAKVVGNNFKKTKAETDSLKEDLAAETSRATAVEDTKADKTALARTDRSLNALWKLNQGVSYEFQTDDTEAYQKMVPSGAKMANVKSIGGKTIVWNQLANPMDTSVFNGIDITKNDDNSNDFHGTISNTATYNDFSVTKSVLFKRDGRKYLIKKNKNISMQWGIDGYGTSTNGNINSFLFTANKGTDWSTEIIIAASKGDVLDISGLYINVFDLTQMFGVENEPTIEEFESMFPADYYPYNAGELMSAPVNEVIYLDTKNQETSYPIPQAILDLDGYGDGVTDNVYNYVDWENKKYHKRVGKVDLGTVNDFILGKPLNDGSGNVFYFTGRESGFKKNGKAISNKLIYSIPLSGQWEDLKLNETYIDSGCYVVVAHNVSTLDEFKQAMSGVILYYELAEEQITDISDLIGDTLQEPIEVEAGGSLTFQNTHGANYRVPVPNTVEYTVKLSEVEK